MLPGEGELTSWLGLDISLVERRQAGDNLVRPDADADDALGEVDRCSADR